MGDDEICATKRSYQSLSQESHKGVSEAYLPKVCYRMLQVSQKGVSQSVLEVCLQEMPTRVPQKGVFKECHRSVSV